MTTSIPSIIASTDYNRLTIADIKVRINNRRAENNEDFLDDTKIVQYINDAIDELNLRDDFRANERVTEYDINTEVTRFYAFTTIFSSTPFERIKEIYFADDTKRDAPLQYGTDYRFEASPSNGAKGIYFIASINAPLAFAHYQFIPKVEDDSEFIQVDHLSNKYFIYKVLQYVYESEDKERKVAYCDQKAEEAVTQLIQNNSDQYDDHMAPHHAFL